MPCVCDAGALPRSEQRKEQDVAKESTTVRLRVLVRGRVCSPCCRLRSWLRCSREFWACVLFPSDLLLLPQAVQRAPQMALHLGVHQAVHSCLQVMTLILVFSITSPWLLLVGWLFFHIKYRVDFYNITHHVVDVAAAAALLVRRIELPRARAVLGA